MAAAGYILKILSGPHLGAEALLAEGEYVCGGADECDIVLVDQGIAPRHLRLVLNGSGMSLARLERAVYLEGEAVGAEAAPLEPFQVITIGTTHLGVAPAGMPWEERALPPLPAPRKDAAAGAIEAVDEAAASEPPESGVENPAQRRSDTGLVHRLLTGAREFPLIFLPVVLVLVAILFLAVFLASAPSAKPAPEPETAARLARVERLIAGLQLFGLRADKDKMGIVVEGYIPTRKEKAELAAALEAFDPPVRLRAAIGEEMAEACQETLKALGLELGVRAAGAGVIRLEGTAPSREALEKATTLLYQDIKGLERIDSRVVVSGDRPTGAGKPEAPVIDLPIRSVSTGAVRYLITTDGKTCFEGGRLAQGYRVEAIHPDRIELSFNGKHYTYMIGGK